MSREQVRSRCPECTWSSIWDDDAEAAYRECLAHQIKAHPRVVLLEERLSDD